MKDKNLRDTIEYIDSVAANFEALLRMFQYAHIWLKSNPDSQGICWVDAVDVLKKIWVPAEVKTSDVSNLVSAISQNAVENAGLLRKKISRISSLLGFLDTAAISQDTNSMVDADLDWADAFESLIDMTGTIEEASQTLWHTIWPPEDALSSRPIANTGN